MKGEREGERGKEEEQRGKEIHGSAPGNQNSKNEEAPSDQAPYAQLSRRRRRRVGWGNFPSGLKNEEAVASSCLSVATCLLYNNANA